MSVITLLNPLLAALSGIIYAGLSPLPGLSVTPNVLVAGVVVVGAVGGLSPATVWALVGGVSANMLVGAPLGSYPIGLLVAAGITVAVCRLAGGGSLPLIFALAALCAVVFDLVIATFTSTELVWALLNDPLLLVASGMVTALVALLIGLVVRAVRGRVAPGESLWLDG